MPFGEYLPFQEYWPVKPVAFRDGRFSAGDGARTFRPAGIPSFSAMICYEVLFPGAVARYPDRPSFLLNVTNDAWYGYTSGPFQHLAIAQSRAVEEGLPMVRAANTGMSAMIDPFGRIDTKRALQTEGILDYPLPAPLKPTLFAHLGNWLFLALLFGFAGLAGIFQVLQTKKIAYVR